MSHSEQHRPEIVVGIVATPPDYPARVAARLTAELAGQLAERVDAGVRWTVREGWGEVAPRRDGGVEALLDDLASRRADGRWDVAICLTDLPLHTNRTPLVAQTSAQRRDRIQHRVPGRLLPAGADDVLGGGSAQAAFLDQFDEMPGSVRLTRRVPSEDQAGELRVMLHQSGRFTAHSGVRDA